MFCVPIVRPGIAPLAAFVTALATMMQMVVITIWIVLSDRIRGYASLDVLASRLRADAQRRRALTQRMEVLAEASAQSSPRQIIAAAGKSLFNLMCAESGLGAVVFVTQLSVVEGAEPGDAGGGDSLRSSFDAAREEAAASTRDDSALQREAAAAAAGGRGVRTSSSGGGGRGGFSRGGRSSSDGSGFGAAADGSAAGAAGSPEQDGAAGKRARTVGDNDGGIVHIECADREARAELQRIFQRAATEVFCGAGSDGGVGAGGTAAAAADGSGSGSEPPPTPKSCWGLHGEPPPPAAGSPRSAAVAGAVAAAATAAASPFAWLRRQAPAQSGSLFRLRGGGSGSAPLSPCSSTTVHRGSFSSSDDDDILVATPTAVVQPPDGSVSSPLSDAAAAFYDLQHPGGGLASPPASAETVAVAASARLLLPPASSLAHLAALSGNLNVVMSDQVTLGVRNFADWKAAAAEGVRSGVPVDAKSCLHAATGVKVFCMLCRVAPTLDRGSRVSISEITTDVAKLLSDHWQREAQRQEKIRRHVQAEADRRQRRFLVRDAVRLYAAGRKEELLAGVYCADREGCLVLTSLSHMHDVTLMPLFLSEF